GGLADYGAEPLRRDDLPPPAHLLQPYPRDRRWPSHRLEDRYFDLFAGDLRDDGLGGGRVEVVVEDHAERLLVDRGPPERLHQPRDRDAGVVRSLGYRAALLRDVYQAPLEDP